MADTPPPLTKYFSDLVQTLPSMQGKTVAITGCTSGMGLVLAKTCARLGARIVMLNRPSDRADAALQDILKIGGEAALVPCDLTSFGSTRAAGATLRQTYADTGIDVLCNNAGIMGMPDTATMDGFDVQMQANHLSHFLLTHAVWPLLEKAGTMRGEARVVNHSSGARGKPGRLLDAKYLRANGGHLGGDGFPGHGKWARYQQSKLANLMFTYALHSHAARRDGNTVKSLCAHPGPVDSGLQAKTTHAGGTRLLDRLIIGRTLKTAQSVEDGTSALAICSCAANVQSGDFFGPNGPHRTGPAVKMPDEQHAQNQALIWTESLKATGIDDFFSAQL